MYTYNAGLLDGYLPRKYDKKLRRLRAQHCRAEGVTAGTQEFAATIQQKNFSLGCVQGEAEVIDESREGCGGDR